MQTAHDPAISSHYVNDELYRKLVEDFADWQREELVVTTPEVRDQFRLLIEREARLLDELRFVPVPNANAAMACAPPESSTA